MSILQRLKRWLFPESDRVLVDRCALDFIDRIRPVTSDLILRGEPTYTEFIAIENELSEALHPYLKHCAVGQAFKKWLQVERNISDVLYKQFSTCSSDELDQLIYNAVFEGLGLKVDQ